MGLGHSPLLGKQKGYTGTEAKYEIFENETKWLLVRYLKQEEFNSIAVWAASENGHQVSEKYLVWN